MRKVIGKALFVALAMVTTVAATPAEATESARSEAQLRWARGGGTTAGEVVAGGTMTTETTLGQMHMFVETDGLNQNHSYTLWIMFFNHPEHCIAPESTEFRCGGLDLFANPLADGSAVYGAGIAEAQGEDDVFFAGRSAQTLPTDPRQLVRYLMSRVEDSVSPVKSPLKEQVIVGTGLLTNLMGAEYQAVLLDHGPYDPARFGDAQWTTHDGGCHIEERGSSPLYFTGRCNQAQTAGWPAYEPWITGAELV